MEYRRFKDRIVARLDPGEEIVAELREIALAEGIKLASVNGLGAVDEFTVGVYDVPKKKYYTQTWKGPHEIVSLTGNINTMDGEFYTHMHMSAGNSENAVLGGHLYEAFISPTAEIFIDVIDGTVDRKKDEDTGINRLEF